MNASQMLGCLFLALMKILVEIVIMRSVSIAVIGRFCLDLVNGSRLFGIGFEQVLLEGEMGTFIVED